MYVQLEDYEAAIEVLEQGITNTESEEMTVYLENLKEEYQVLQNKKESGESANGAENPDERADGENNGAREETIYNGDGSYWIYEYDENGNKIKEIYYSADGTITTHMAYEYDANGNVIKSTIFNTDGTIISETDY